MLPNTLFIMFTSLFSLSNLLISNVGFISTFRVLNTVRRIIYNYEGRVSLTRINRLFNSLSSLNLNPFVLQNIRTPIFNCIRDCLRYQKHVNNMFFMLLTSVIYSSFKNCVCWSILIIKREYILYNLYKLALKLYSNIT